MSKHAIKIIPKCSCCCCGPAVCHSSSNEDMNACDKCCAHDDNSHCKPIEIWICGHVRKCGWQGQHHELKHIPDPVFGTGPLAVQLGTCPKCGSIEFYTRPLHS